MPNGTAHRTMTKILGLTNLPLFFVLDPITCVGVQTGIFLTHWINCDNDITTHRLGFYRWLGFDAYNRLIAHRAGLRVSNWANLTIWKLLFFSHFPVTGTLLRFAIVLYLPLILLLIISALQPWMFWFILGVLGGMCESDALHILADIVWSALRKMFPWLKRYDDKRDFHSRQKEAKRLTFRKV